MKHRHHRIHNEFKYIYQYRCSDTKIKYELYSWETCAITKETQKNNHEFSKITRWINSRKNKTKYRSCHHIALIKIFPTSQEFCNSDSVWESYANFIEDAQKFLYKNELLLCCCKKNLRLISTNSLIYIHHWIFLDVFIYTLKWTCFMLVDLSSKVRVVRILIFNCKL